MSGYKHFEDLIWQGQRVRRNLENPETLQTWHTDFNPKGILIAEILPFSEKNHD